MRLVFFVEDDDKNIIGEKTQIEIKITEEELKAADIKDADARKKDEEMIGDCFSTRANFGRGKYVREVFEATGTIVNKWLDRNLSPRFGCNHIDALDAYMKAKKK